MRRRGYRDRTGPGVRMQQKKKIKISIPRIA
jgi:hypothetical protein